VSAVTVDLEKLLAARADTASGLPEDDVEVPSMGTVRVRGLSRDEVFGTQQISNTAVRERKVLALAMISPAMTEAQAAKWQMVSPAGEIEPVTDKIHELSGLAEDASKSGVPADGHRPEPGVRTLPGGQAVDDDRAAAREDG
jgi:hypothetical protein